MTSPHVWRIETCFRRCLFVVCFHLSFDLAYSMVGWIRWDIHGSVVCFFPYPLVSLGSPPPKATIQHAGQSAKILLILNRLYGCTSKFKVRINPQNPQAIQTPDPDLRSRPIQTSRSRPVIQTPCFILFRFVELNQTPCFILEWTC